MLKLKLQYFGYLMGRADSFEKTLMLGKIEDRRRRGQKDRRLDDWMVSLTRWTWVWAGSRSWWWTGKPGMLQSMGSQRVGHDWGTELTQTDFKIWVQRFLGRETTRAKVSSESSLSIEKGKKEVSMAEVKGTEVGEGVVIGESGIARRAPQGRACGTRYGTWCSFCVPESAIAELNESWDWNEQHTWLFLSVNSHWTWGLNTLSSLLIGPLGPRGPAEFSLPPSRIGLFP